jgi:hypothetical protein
LLRFVGGLGSGGVIAALGIQDRLQLGQVPFGLARVAFEFARGLLRHVVGQDAQGLPGLERADIGLGRALEVVETVERLGHVVPDHQDTVVAHDKNPVLGIRQQPRAARALVLEGQPAIAVVDDVTVEEGRAVLVDGGQRAVGQAGQHRGMDGMHVHHAARMRAQPVNRAMQPPGRGIGRAGPVHRFRVVGIQQQQVRGPDSGEVHLVGIHQEPRAVTADRKAEMIGHRLVHVQPRGPAEGRRHVDPFLPVGQVCALAGVQHRVSPFRVPAGCQPRAGLTNDESGAMA